MTRFEMELSGSLGEYWRSNAWEQVARIQASADNGEIGVDKDGAAYWLSSIRYLPEDVAQMLRCTTFEFDFDATTRARDRQTAESLEKYRRRMEEYYNSLGNEEMAEMRAAFGEGSVVVDVITGKRIRV